MDKNQLEELDEIMEEDEEELEEEQEPKKSNQKEKPLDSFELCIKEYLDQFAEQDSCFKEKYDSSKIRECVQYIYSEVKKSGRCGFERNRRETSAPPSCGARSVFGGVSSGSGP